MVNELKFRAWHKIEKRMSKPFTFKELSGYDDGSVYIDGFGKGDSLSSENWEVMEYLGVDDKNGKEIYKNDIVIADWHYEEPITLDDVISFHYDIREYGLDGQITLLGNIYENPELLK